MTTAIQPFAFADQTVRVVVDEHGEPWFVAGDVTALLGYSNGRDAVAKLPERMRSSVALSDGTPGNPNRAVLNEAGVNRLIMRSTLPAAESIQDWLAETVMPSIRKTGSYSTAPELPAMPSHSEALRAWAAELEAREIAEARVAELEPKAEVADRLLNADGDVSVGDAAKILTRGGIKVGADRLFRLLAGWKWIYRAAGDGRWRVAQRAIETGYMSVINQSHYHPKTGLLVMDPPQPRVTPKGIQKVLNEHGASHVDAAQLMFGDSP